MTVFSSDSKQRKNNLIALQNIVLDINEKKLQVSEEFLDQMTKIYISKYMKVVNEQIADMGKVTNISLLFKKYDVIMDNIDELIKIESLYKFNKPIPSDYKKMVEEQLGDFINDLIAREWRKICPPPNSTRMDALQEKKYTAFFNAFDRHLKRMPEDALDTLEKLRKSVFPENNSKEPDIIHLSDDSDKSDEFVPEEFPEIPSPQANTEQADTNAQ